MLSNEGSKLARSLILLGNGFREHRHKKIDFGGSGIQSKMEEEEEGLGQEAKENKDSLQDC